MSLRFALTAVLLVSMTTVTFADSVVMDDDFESYLDPSALQSKWVSTIGSTSSTFLATQAAPGPYPLSPLPGALDGQAAVFDGTVGIGSGSVNQWATPFSIAPSATQNVELTVDLAYDGTPFDKKLSVGLRYTNGTVTENLIELGFWNAFAFSPILQFAHRAVLPSGGDNWQPYGLDSTLNEIGEINSKAGELAGTPGTPQAAHFHRFKAIISQSDIKFTLDLFGDGMNNLTNTPGIDAMDIDADAVVTADGFNDLRFGIPSASGSSTNPFLGVDNISLKLVDIVVPTGNADFDTDGDVDGKDFLTWQRNSGLMGGATLMDGDANNDQKVDAVDLGIWQTQYGTPLTPSLAAVPEPASAVLLLLAMAGLVGRIRR